MFGGTFLKRACLSVGILSWGVACLLGTQATSVSAATAGLDSDSERLSYIADGFTSHVRLSTYSTAGGVRYLLDDGDVSGQIGLVQTGTLCSNAAPGSIDCARVSSYLLQLTEGADSVFPDLSPTYTRRLVVVALGGDDEIVGAAGADALDAGNGNDQIDGWLGDDWITGGLGNDQERGWAGRDRFSMGAASDGNDLVDGGDDEDIVDYSQRTRSLRITVGVNTDSDGDTGIGERDVISGNIEEVRGGSAGDDLTAGPSGTNLAGNDGDDRLVGSLNSDTLSGGNDDDTIRAVDGGIDTVSCGYGYDDVWLDPTDLVVDLGACEQVQYGNPIPVAVPPVPGGSSPRPQPEVTKEAVTQTIPERVVERTTTTNQIVKETLLSPTTPAIAGVAQPKVKIVSATRKGSRVLLKLSYSGPANKLLLSYLTGKKIRSTKRVVVAANPKKPVSFSLSIKKADTKLLSRKGRKIKLKVSALIEGTKIVALKSVTSKKRSKG